MSWLRDFVFGKIQPIADKEDIVAEIVEPIIPEVDLVAKAGLEPEVIAEEPPVLVRLYPKKKKKGKVKK